MSDKLKYERFYHSNNCTVDYLELCKKCYTKPRYHNEVDELIHICSGELVFYHNGSVFILNEEESVFIKKGDSHGSYVLSESANIIAVCTPEYLDEYERISDEKENELFIRKLLELGYTDINEVVV